MGKNTNINHVIQLNVAFVFMATAGTLARYIDMPVPFLIGFRAIVAGFIIFLFCKWKGIELRIPKADRGVVFLSGVLMGVHWITYFYSLRLSNVAVGMISLFTFPVITAFLEPVILKHKFRKIQIVLGLIVLLGVYFLVPELDFKNSYFIAICVGVFSALLFSLRNIISKGRLGHYNGSVIMMYQMVVVAVFLGPTYFLYDDIDIIGQLPAGLTLALLTTALGHTMFLTSLKHFSVTSVSIVSSTQLVYGILIALFFLKEYPDSNAVVGGAIILLSVVLESLGSARKDILNYFIKAKKITGK
ncbi:DMT family transporter [Plebeiibacterium marinum]|uniref:DMT family transporter n=1 Tax=Plebeiibacterium marinum TaxID=2992111 RepID=A0AAE3MH69_9BACT|nr:DMT family transporter [Plebeiobacterium marinum]MCW3807641.1 DMT family transporter [Plebeiobacterium marinum]